VVDCAPCSASTVNDAVLLNPGHAVMLTGSGPLTADADIGAANNPVVLVVAGSLEFTGTPATVHGVVYSRAANWTTAGTGTLRGAAVAEGDLTVVGDVSVVHDSAVLTRLRVTTGSFVRSPGGWRDTAP
jgi:predicted amino acid racemase